MPTQIGRYEIKSKLGEGGMAIVYLARDPNFGREVVIKVIRREFSAHPEFRARFNREAQVIAALEHESIVPVYDFGILRPAQTDPQAQDDDQPYLVMRYMTGGTLGDHLMNGPLSLPDAAQVVARIADALDYAHSQGIVHRDLKPANILFDNRGKAYLSDFGIAKLAESTTNLTGTSIVGTPTYMSPEQARSQQDLDRRSDVYSLGVLVFELLTGELPYKAGDAIGMAIAHLIEPPPEIRKVRPDLPGESDALIKRAMAKKPDDRYQTTGELAAHLSKIATPPRATPDSPNRGLAPAPQPPDKPKIPLGDLRPAVRAPQPTISLAALGIGSTRVSEKDGMVMVYVPEGKFMMGSNDGKADEKPAHVVRLDAFWIDRTEVTNAMFIRFLREMLADSRIRAHSDRVTDSDGNALYYYYRINRSGSEFVLQDEKYADHPVVSVTWHGANAYCKWAGRRLPTEAEWEKAARGDDSRKYPWGDIEPDSARLNFRTNVNNVGDTTEAGRYPNGASPYGALDMAGNVWDWVNDWYDENYYRNSPSENPPGPSSGQYRVLRGGSWYGGGDSVRATVRNGGGSSFKDNDIGFRCAR